MRVSLLDLDRPGAYAAYLPDPLPEAAGGVRRGLALHDGETAWGAAVVEVGDSAVDILSLLYADSAPEGACEQALTQALVSRAEGSAIRELVYVVQGTRQTLETLDDRLLPLGYFPRDGSAQPLETTLEALLQNPHAQRLLACRPGPGVAALDENVPLRAYNQAHPGDAIRLDQLDRATSCCYVEGSEIKAVLQTRRHAGTLTLEWLASTASNQEVLRWLLCTALTATAASCPPETRVVLAAFPGAPLQLAETLGFTPTPGLSATRIYTYHLR